MCHLLSNKKSWSSGKSLGLGLGLEPQGLGLGLGLEPQGLGLGLEQQGLGLGLGLHKKVLVTALARSMVKSKHYRSTKVRGHHASDLIQLCSTADT